MTARGEAAQGAVARPHTSGSYGRSVSRCASLPDSREPRSQPRSPRSGSEASLRLRVSAASRLTAFSRAIAPPDTFRTSAMWLSAGGTTPVDTAAPHLTFDLAPWGPSIRAFADWIDRRDQGAARGWCRRLSSVDDATAEGAVSEAVAWNFLSNRVDEIHCALSVMSSRQRRYQRQPRIARATVGRRLSGSPCTCDLRTRSPRAHRPRSIEGPAPAPLPLRRSRPGA